MREAANNDVVPITQGVVRGGNDTVNPSVGDAGTGAMVVHGPRESDVRRVGDRLCWRGDARHAQVGIGGQRDRNRADQNIVVLSAGF